MSENLQATPSPNLLPTSRSPSSIRRSLRRYSPLAHNNGNSTRSTVTQAMILNNDSRGGYRAVSPAVLEEGEDSTASESEHTAGTSSSEITVTISREDRDRLIAELDSLKATIERQKRLLRSRVKSLERVKEEVAQVKQQRAEVQNELDEKEEELANSKKNEQQYRNWWLNEIQFTKLLLNKIPDPNRDIDLVRASQAHYLGHY
ncbi:hypothetical protein BKA70DRAFT_1452234 [Coprinopsis sp. MPI-PUGE-AT-0042]|nr:hypothetical protein BKA70DRAFT_1452234 [Coprinopsis sp. MPI-PUGE-AT-0042]